MEIHYFRNTINKDVAPKTLEELYAINDKLNEEEEWLLLSVSEAMFHMNGPNGEYNTKFVLGVGQHFEVVYDSDGNLVTEDSGTNGAENMGTYNFVGPSDGWGHGINDVNTYYKWENTPELDPTVLDGYVDYNVQALANKKIYEKNMNAIEQYENKMSRANPERYKRYMEEKARKEQEEKQRLEDRRNYVPPSL